MAFHVIRDKEGRMEKILDDKEYDSYQKRKGCFQFLFFVAIVGLIIGIIAMATTQEHTYKIMLSDTYPANKLYEQFKVEDIDGLIYTVIEKT